MCVLPSPALPLESMPRVTWGFFLSATRYICERDISPLIWSIIQYLYLKIWSFAHQVQKIYLNKKTMQMYVKKCKRSHITNYSITNTLNLDCICIFLKLPLLRMSEHNSIPRQISVWWYKNKNSLINLNTKKKSTQFINVNPLFQISFEHIIHWIILVINPKLYFFDICIYIFWYMMSKKRLSLWNWIYM